MASVRYAAPTTPLVREVMDTCQPEIIQAIIKGEKEIVVTLPDGKKIKLSEIKDI